MLFLRALSFVPFVFVVKIRREERDMVQWFRARGALDEDRAVTFRADGSVARWVYDRLVRNGVLKAAGDRVYFEESGYAAYRRRRRHRALVVIALLLIGLAIALFRGDVTL